MTAPKQPEKLNQQSTSFINSARERNNSVVIKNKAAFRSVFVMPKNSLNALNTSVTSQNFEDKLSNRAMKMIEQQERQKQILLKRYADQKDRIFQQKNIEKKLKEAENKKSSYFKEQVSLRLKSVTKRDEIIQKMQDEARHENKFGWRRRTDYDN